MCFVVSTTEFQWPFSIIDQSHSWVVILESWLRCLSSRHTWHTRQLVDGLVQSFKWSRPWSSFRIFIVQLCTSSPRCSFSSFSWIIPLWLSFDWPYLLFGRNKISMCGRVERDVLPLLSITRRRRDPVNWQRDDARTRATSLSFSPLLHFHRSILISAPTHI